MSWVLPDDGGVIHYVPAGATPLGHSIYQRGRGYRANGRCLCSRVREGEDVTLPRRGQPAIRCGKIARARGIALPPGPFNWYRSALNLANAVLIGDDANAKTLAAAIKIEEEPSD